MVVKRKVSHLTRDSHTLQIRILLRIRYQLNNVYYNLQTKTIKKKIRILLCIRRIL